jgi:serine/threonine-protein kinase
MLCKNQASKVGSIMSEKDADSAGKPISSATSEMAKNTSKKPPNSGYDALWDSVDRIQAEAKAEPGPSQTPEMPAGAPLQRLASAPGSGRQARLDPSLLKSLAHKAAQATLEIPPQPSPASMPAPRVGELRTSLAEAVGESGDLARTPEELDAQTAMKPNPLNLPEASEAGGARIIRDEQSAPDPAPAAAWTAHAPEVETATITLERKKGKEEREGPKRIPVAGEAIEAERYRDDGVIARGGFGAIHQVMDDSLNRRAAMKVLDSDRAGNEKDVLRFFEEAQITGQLDHPNIVPVHELGMDKKGRHYFTMKLVRGQTLKQILEATDFEQRSPLELDRALQIIVKVCDALSFAHSKGVVHRDLKPDNIMVGTHGQVYLMDWGIAQLNGIDRPSEEGAEAAVEILEHAKSEAEVTGTIIGTPAYMAPEQALGDIHDIDHRTDVFALGGLLYQILTDEAPYRGADAIAKVTKAQKCKVVPPQERAPGWSLPPGLCRITMKALSKSRAKRHQSVAELKAEIETFLRGGFWFAEKTFKKGALVIEEGDEATSAFILTNGTCEAFKSDGDDEMILRQMGPGDVFGETAILTGKTRTASVRALTRVSTMVVTREALEAELSGDSWTGSLVKVLAERFRDLDETLVGAVRKVQAQEVVIAAFSHLATGGKGQCSLKSLLKKLRNEFDRTDEELLAHLEENGFFEVDLQARTVRVKT